MFMSPASAESSDLKSISASSSGVMPSPPPPLCHERRCPCAPPCPEGCSPSDSSPSSPSSSPSAPPRPPVRTAKYTSKAVSKARQCEDDFTSVAASAYFSASRSSSGICLTASAASRCSVNETGRPERRSSVTKPERRSSTDSARRGRQQLLGGPLDVGLILEQDVQGVLGPGGVDRLHTEQHERAGPVDRFGDRRRLAELERAQRSHDAGHLVGQLLADTRHLGPHDLALALEVRVVDVQVEAAALERLGELAGVVGCEEHHRQLRRPHRTELGDRHLVLREDLEQQRLRLELDAVDLVDDEHDRFGAPDLLEQRPRQQEVLGEDVLLQLGPARALLLTLAVLAGLNPQQLLAVVPLVERLGLVEALVTLQTDEPGSGELRHRLGQLRLAGSGRPLDQHRLGQPVGEEHDAADRLVGQVADLGEAAPHGVQGLEPGGTAFRGAQCCVPFTPLATYPSPRTIHFNVVSSFTPIGPRACSFWVDLPPSAPSPNSSPSTNLVDAFTSTAAPSTSATNRSATATSEVTIASEWPELYRAMCSIASPTSSTIPIATTGPRNSVEKPLSRAGTAL